MPIETISTPRLILMALSPAQLRMYLEEEHQFNRQIGLASRNILTENLRRAIEMKLEKMAAAPVSDLPWFTYWLINLPPIGFGAGLIGFKGAPDQNGEVEIGYGIDPDFQGQGYMTEAVKGMIHWAFQEPRCSRILAVDTLRTNPASNRVLEKVGMRVYQEKPDSLSWHLKREWGE